jgi:transglutaminase-like putative cysteine protease
MKKMPAPAMLQYSSLPWLLAVTFFTALPHGLYQPVWICGAASLVLLGVVWRWRRGYRVMTRWLKIPLVIAAGVGILLQYHTLLNYEAGISLLILSVILKLLELKSRRDAVVVVTLAYFLLLALYFYSQSLLAAFWLLLGPLLITAALIQLYDDPERPGKALFFTATRLLLQALPFMLLLYLFFPRVNEPIWGLPQDGFIPRSGLSEILDPGAIANLILSDEIAFRVQFHGGAAPNSSALYWRGPVLSAYDGRAWRSASPRGQRPIFSALENPVTYTLTLEAHNKHWLLPLEITPDPSAVGENSGAYIDDNGSARSRRPITSRRRTNFTSYLRYRLDAQVDARMLRHDLQLPGRERNPRTLEMARAWQAENPDPRQLARRALEYFRQEAFFYTLRPPLLGQNAVDDFLFSTRSGFCEHYASAFVVLMRAAGVPARIVTGYKGGEFNPVDSFLTVRQSDAHAWAEIWLENEGWIRVDPTSAIPPERIESSVAERLQAQKTIDWLQSLRFQWEAINNRWNQWVLGYTPEQQLDLLAALGLKNADWRILGGIMSVSMGFLLLITVTWMFRSRRKADPARAIWQQALRFLGKRGVSVYPWEAPLTLAQRLKTEAPRQANAVLILARLVCDARYGGKPVTIKAMRLALEHLSRT